MPKFLVKAKLQKMFVIESPNMDDAKSQVLDKELESFIVLEATELNASTDLVAESDNLSVDAGGLLRTSADEELRTILGDEDGSDQ